MVENIRFDITARDETTRAFRQIDANLNRTMAGFRKFEAGITGFRGTLGTTLAAAASVTGLVYLEKRFVDLGSNVGDTADKIGLSTGELQELRYGAQLAGVETETLDSAMLVFTRNLGQAELGLGKTGDALAALGIGFADIRDRSPAEIFGKVADGLAKIEDPMKRNALAAQLFGRAGAQLGPLLAQGSAGIEDFSDKAQRLGIVVGDSIIRRNQEAGDSFDTIDTAIAAAGMTIASEFLPVIEDVESIVTSGDFQQGLRATASGIAGIVQSAIDNADVLFKVAEGLIRVRLAMAGWKIGAAIGGVPGGVIGAGVAGYGDKIAALPGAAQAQADSMQSGEIVPGSGGQRVPKRPLVVDGPMVPANQAEIDQYNAARDALALGLRNNAAKKGDWSGGDWLDGGDGFTSGGFGGGGGSGGGKSKGGSRASEHDRAAEAIKRVTENLEEERAMLGMTDRERTIYNDLLRAGVTESDSAGQAIAALSGKLYDETDALQRSQEAWNTVRDGTLDFASGIKSDLLQGATAVEALGNAFGQLGDRLLDLALNQAINSFFDTLSSGGGGGGSGGGILSLVGSLLGGIGRNAGGTDNWRGGLSLVGEQGPELLNIPRGAQVITNRNLAALRSINAGKPLGNAQQRGGGAMSVALHQTIQLDGANGDEAVRRIAGEAVAQGGQALLQTVRGSVTSWMMQDQMSRGGEYRK